ncbi:hypothetical protein H4Q32_027089 [Labeo rohita]|uniref:Uncharacterized protein n=1 Tax=Labeo rohita TaxID=84645 RepID=A0ABQ8LC99_LABRO|nr:hypothetical protein H4Q32_027089 [Labeo rohita]
MSLQITHQIHLIYKTHTEDACKRPVTVIKGIKGFMSETLSTLLAGEKLLSSVSSHVSPEVCFFKESLSTVSTHKRLLSSVSHYVLLKLIPVCETQSTLMADKTALS